ncbi:hypothetical protein KUTeg_016998 [Tegillarca granosa]|uniref:SCP domain-containing protein n=1 Tax=Tegillarca granosa TaxID=220873 RepID=A0ABQ9EMH5_TEGGR|nr:hypothetical protein KUTeg_016998 [Tegillarca granosa]
MYTPFFVLILVNSFKVCQPEVTQVGADIKQMLIDIHNKYRSMQRSSDMQKQTWSNTLAEEAQGWIKRCVFDHKRKERGENLAYNTFKSKTVEEKINGALESWYDEISNYNSMVKVWIQL